MAGLADDLVCELVEDLLEDVVVGDVLAERVDFFGRNTACVVAPVLPDLEFVIGAKGNVAFAIGGWPLDVLLGEGATLHVADGG